MRTGRPNLIPSESDLTAPSTPPPAMVTEEVARTAVELAMKVADVLLQVIKKRQPWIRVPEDAGSADGRPNRALWSGNKAVAEITIGGGHGPDAGDTELVDQAVLQRAVDAFTAPPRLRGIRRDVLDA